MIYQVKDTPVYSRITSTYKHPSVDRNTLFYLVKTHALHSAL